LFGFCLFYRFFLSFFSFFAIYFSGQLQTLRLGLGLWLVGLTGGVFPMPFVSGADSAGYGRLVCPVPSLLLVATLLLLLL
jgi:hypothetical protein